MLYIYIQYEATQIIQGQPTSKEKYIRIFTCVNLYIYFFIHVFQIKMSFLPVGHMHEDIDQMFSCYVRRLSKHNAKTLPELMEEIQAGFLPSVKVKLLQSLFDVKRTISVPRCFKPPGFSPLVNVQLHHFSDASEIGFGAVSYLRIVDEKGAPHCSFFSWQVKRHSPEGSVHTTS